MIGLLCSISRFDWSIVVERWMMVEQKKQQERIEQSNGRCLAERGFRGSFDLLNFWKKRISERKSMRMKLFEGRKDVQVF